MILILLLALGLRLAGAQTRPLWYDEAFSALLAQHGLPAIIAGTGADTMPPLFYFLLHFWGRIAGGSPFAMRFLMVSLSVLLVCLAFAIGARVAGPRAGLWAALLTTLAAFQLYHAQELRMYALLALGLLFYLYGLLRWRAGLRFGGALIVLGTAVAIYAHNLSFLTLAVGVIYLLFQREWRATLQLIALQAIAALLFIPWLVSVPGQIDKIQRAFWTLPPGPVDLLQMLVIFTAYLPLPGWLLPFALFMTLAVAVLAGRALYRLRRQGSMRQLDLLLAFALIPPVLMFVVSYLMRPVFVPRGLIASGLAYYVLLAILIARAPQAGQWLAAGVVAAVACACLPVVYSSWGEWRRAPFEQADSFLRSHMQPEDAVLHDNKLSFFSMYYYDRDLAQRFLADPPGSANDTLSAGSQVALDLFPVEMEQALMGKTRVWFVILQTAIDEAAAEGHPHGNIARLEHSYRLASTESLGDLRILQYERR